MPLDYSKNLKPPKCSLYRTLWFNSLGYVVYRHCFEVFGDEITVRIGAVQHKTAAFVTEAEAIDYCDYRNRLIDLNGDDGLPPKRRA